jgi:hypothetical protein
MVRPPTQKGPKDSEYQSPKRLSAFLGSSLKAEIVILSDNGYDIFHWRFQRKRGPLGRIVCEEI